MKGLIAALCALALGALACATSLAQETPAATPTPDTLRVMSFNIRTSTAKDGPNAWPLRKDLFFSTIESFNPDLLGLQEVQPDQAEVAKTLKGYGYVGVARDDGKSRGEASPCMFRTDRFDKIDEGHFWLSETPDVVGSIGWDARLTRVCSWVKLKEKQTGRELYFFNTHWDHIGVKARVESGKLMRSKIERIAKGAPAVVTGDFNSTETTEQYRTMLGAASDPVRLVDSWELVHPGKKAITFHGFSGKPQGNGRIDWILHTPDLKAVEATVDHHNKDGRYPSDHFPVTAVLHWPTKPQSSN